ncbi:hypothetical protein AK812_SmicGene42640 [Symbiodinium microadriaticum]|uniref:Uncharacterized protein n=1 Tax=Symbiodinium microadriaticum TaxID=2951 RepID=A0A1Q9C316_SYMMI|nr:hypothetical protein AK812_SmicGene42640 [Symbiodinium microadriaticum]
MRAAAQSWQCASCHQWCKAAASFCGNCGSRWNAHSQPSSQQYSWGQEAYGQWPVSPRRRNPSPRKRGKGRGKQDAGKGQPKGKPKGETGEPPVAKAAPTTASLPGAPTAPATTAPKPFMASNATASQERQQLDMLVQSLSANRGSIPAETLNLLDKLQAETTQHSAKALHRAVTAQASACRELDKIRNQRMQYLDQWATYMDAVIKLLTTQMEEQGQVLEEFTTRETQWTDTLKKARAELARHSASERDELETEDDKMNANEEMVDQAIADEQQLQMERQRQQEDREKLQLQLAAIRENVHHQAAEARREGSRTPRRKAEQVDLTIDEQAEHKGPLTSPFGGCGPDPARLADKAMSLAHSVRDEHNFVSDLFAGWLGVNAAFEVALADLDVQHTYACDPRLDVTAADLVTTFWGEVETGTLTTSEPVIAMRLDGRPLQQACLLTARLGVERGTQGEAGPAQNMSESCTNLYHSRGSRACTGKLVRGSMHMHRHPLPFQVTFSDQNIIYRNLGRRAFSTCIPRAPCKPVFPPLTPFPGTGHLFDTLSQQLRPLASTAPVLQVQGSHRPGPSQDPIDAPSQQLWSLANAAPAPQVPASPRTRSFSGPVDALSQQLRSLAGAAQVLQVAGCHRSGSFHGLVDAHPQQLWSLANTALAPLVSAGHGIGSSTSPVVALSQQSRSLASTAPVLQVADSRMSGSFQNPVDAQSQHAQPVACTAHTPPAVPNEQLPIDAESVPCHLGWPCLRGPITGPTDPPALLGKLGPPRPSHISKLGLARIDLIPAHLLQYPVVEIPVDQLGLFALDPGKPRQVMRFSVFDPDRHHVHRTASQEWSLADLVSEAIRSYGEPVRAAQVLEQQMPGVASPQIVLTPQSARPNELCVPIDMRPFGGRPCTMLLQAGAQAADVIRAALQACPRGPAFLPPFHDERGLYFLDARGQVWHELPHDLSQLQWLRVSSAGPLDVLTAEEDFVAQGALPSAGPTTATSTWVGHSVVEHVSFVLTGMGITLRLHPQHVSQVRIIDSVADLTMALARQRAMPPRARLVLTAGQPHPQTRRHVTILLLLYPEDHRRHVVLDPSSDGSMAQSISVDARTCPEELVAAAQAREGYVAFVNGCPQAASRRVLYNGDYTQVVRMPAQHRVAPTDWFYELFPELRLLAFPIVIPRLERATANPLEPMVQTVVRDAFVRYLRQRFEERTQAVGQPAADTQAVIVQGAAHTPALLYVPGRICPVLSEVEDALRATGLFAEGTTFADSCHLTHQHAPLFLSIPPGMQNLGIFFPVPTFWMGYHLMWLPPGSNIGAFTLPTRRGFVLYAPPEMRQAAAATTRSAAAPPPERLARGTSLVQLPDESARLQRRCLALREAHARPDCACEHGKLTCPTTDDRPTEACREGQITPVTAIPTPFGRRRIPDTSGAAAGFATAPAPQPLCLEQLLPLDRPTQPEAALRFPLPADIEGHAFEAFDLGHLQPDVPATVPLMPVAASFLAALPRAGSATTCDALMLFVDGSYRDRPVLCCDANARFSLQAGREIPANANAHRLQETIAKYELCRTSSYAPDGSLHLTWRSPQGCPACLDYVLIPRAWESGLRTVSGLGLLDMHAGIDHEVLGAELRLQLHAPARREAGLDRDSMMTPWGRQAVARLFADAPLYPWSTNSDDHLQGLHAYLLQGAQTLFPRRRAGPRRPVLSQHTWHLLHLRRWARRVFRRRQQWFNREQLWAIIRGWRGLCRQGSALLGAGSAKVFDQRAAHYVRFMQQLTASLRASTASDEARFTREHFTKARQDGPRAMAAAIRAVLKHGRRYKPPLPATILHTSSGDTLTEEADVKAAFGKHFAVSERATACPFAQLAEVDDDGVPASIIVDALPSVVDLSSAFASMKCGKTPGPTLLPAELFKAAPLEAALSIMPVLLKSQARQRFPLLWRGVHSIALLKPNKPPCRVDSHRAIALMSTTGKAVAKACRPVLAKNFETITLPSVGGSRKSVPIELPSLLVQAYLSHLESAKLNGAVLFLDGVAAFPSTDRSLLFDLSDAQLQAKLHEASVEPAVARHFRQALRGQGALARARVPDDMVQFLNASLRGTWFSTDPQSATAYATTSGTLPGAPNADLAFQYAAQASLTALSAHLAKEDISASLTLPPDQKVHALPATWLDDLALLVSSPDAQQLPHRVARATCLAVQYLRLLGVETNFAAGKTEAVLHLCGKGSQQVQRDCLLGVDHGPCSGIAVALPDGKDIRLRCVSRYTHLGTIRTGGAEVAGDISRRLGLAREALKPVRARLLCNANFTEAEKRSFLFSLVLSRLLHNAGTWVFQTKGHSAAYRKGYVSLLRACVRPVLGYPCRRLTDQQVCAVLGAMLPQEAIACARIRVLAAITDRGHPFLQAVLMHERQWWNHALEDVRIVADVLRDPQLKTWTQQADRAAAFLAWPLSPQATANLLRRFRKAAVDGRQDLIAAAAAKAKAHDAADRAGVIYAVLPEVRAFDPECQCSVCHACFSTRAAAAAHLAKRHGLHAAAHFAVGTACQACMRQFWSTARLKQHLRSSRSCAGTYAGADLAEEVPVLDRGDQRLPPVSLIGPRPFWGSLRPPLAQQHPATADVSIQLPANHSRSSCVPLIVQHFRRLQATCGHERAVTILNAFAPQGEYGQLAKLAALMALRVPDGQWTARTEALTILAQDDQLAFGPHLAVRDFGPALFV